MDNELKQYLDSKFQTVDSRFQYIDGKFADLRAEFRADLEATETRLLSEFVKWGRSADQRIRRVEHSDATTVDRLASMEERIFTLERRVAGSKE